MALIGTEELLDANDDWTGSPVKTYGLPHIRGLVYSDKGGSLDVEVSANGTRWIKLSTVSVTGETGAAFDANIGAANWVRLKYTNGADAQTEFELSARVTKK